MKKLLIGGAALRKLGSSRSTLDIDYFVNDKTRKETFFFDKANNIDYVNANGHKFFAALWKKEEKNTGEIATPQTLLEMKAWAFIQHCLNGYFQKADEAEFDIKFLVRNFHLSEVKTIKKFIALNELEEINKIIKSVKK